MHNPLGLHLTRISQKGKLRPSDDDSLLPHGKLSLLQFLFVQITVSEPLHEDPGDKFTPGMPQCGRPPCPSRVRVG